MDKVHELICCRMVPERVTSDIIMCGQHGFIKIQLLQGICLYTGDNGNKVICVPPYELFHGFVMFHSLPKCKRPCLFGLKGFEGVACLAAFIHITAHHGGVTHYVKEHMQPLYGNLP